MSERPRILWLHTQPEHYFNCMIDDLCRVGKCEYVAAFTSKGQGLYSEMPVPRVAESIFLKRSKGMEDREASAFGRVHEDWRKDLYPLKFDAAIVAGYGWRTQREVIRDCRRRGVPVAMWTDSNLRSQHGGSVKMRVKRALKRRALGSLLKDLDYVLAANRLGVAYWRYFGAPPSKIVLCSYYADYSRVEAGRRSDRAEVLARVGVPEGARYLFSAARLVPAKGLDLLIEVYKESGLAEAGVHCVVAGNGPLEQVLKKQAGDMLGKWIHFVGFQQPAENLALMAHADLFVLPSVYEPHGIVIQESMAAGTPVLASDVCGAAYDLVKRQVSGQLFRSGDAGDLRVKLMGLFSDAGALARMRAGTRATFERWFEKTSPIKIVEAVSLQMMDKVNKIAGEVFHE